MTSGRWARTASVAVAAVAIGAALWQLSLELRLFGARWDYPFDVEWLEGSALYQGWRHGHLQSTYGSPQSGYLPLAHPPAYPVLLGIVGRFVTLDYPVARSVSLAFFLAIVALFVIEARRHHADGQPLHGWVDGALAAGCAAAAVPLFDAFYDLVREDVMSMALCVLGACLATPPRWTTRRIAVLAGVFTLVVFTRLPAVFMPVWITIFVMSRQRRAGVLLGLATIAGCGLALVGMLFASRGWYWFITVSVLAKHPVGFARFLEGLLMLVKFAPLLPVVAVAAIALAIKRRLSARSVLWIGMLLAAVPASLLPFAKYGGYSNDLMPLAVFYGPPTVFVMADLVRAFSAHPGTAAALRAGIHIGLAAFLLVRTWDPSRYAPSAEHWRRAKALNARVASLRGGAIVPRHPFLPIRHTPEVRQFSEMPYMDLRWSRFTFLDLGSYLDKTDAQWALVSGRECDHTAAALAARYQLDSAIPDGLGAVIGDQTPLRWLLRKRDDDTRGRVVFDFEDGLQGWTAEGDAFVGSPSAVRVHGMLPIQGAVGNRLVHSFHPKLGDVAKGKLTSPTFVLDRPRLAVRLGGNNKSRVRAELHLDGRAVRKQSGIFDEVDTLVTVVWDVSRLSQRTAQLVLIDDDDDAWGHILFDHVVLY